MRDARGVFIEEKSVKSARRLPPGVSGPAACSRLGGRPRHIAGLAAGGGQTSLLHPETMDKIVRDELRKYAGVR